VRERRLGAIQLVAALAEQQAMVRGDGGHARSSSTRSQSSRVSKAATAAVMSTTYAPHRVERPSHVHVGDLRELHHRHHRAQQEHLDHAPAPHVVDEAYRGSEEEGDAAELQATSARRSEAASCTTGTTMTVRRTSHATIGQPLSKSAWTRP
jgi:hypothetical protein